MGYHRGYRSAKDEIKGMKITFEQVKILQEKENKMEKFEDFVTINEKDVSFGSSEMRTLTSWADDIVFASSDAHNALVALKRKGTKVDALIKNLLKINDLATKLNSNLKGK